MALVPSLLGVSLLAASPVAPTPEQAQATAKSFPRILVLGIDATSLNVLEPFVATGVTPNLGRLMQEGSVGELASFWPLRTPQVWTSIATGKLPGQHGIWDHASDTAYNPPPFKTAKRTVLTSRERKSQAVWRLLATRGVSNLVVGWVSTYPAEVVPGLTMAAPAMLARDKRQVSIKGTFWRDATDQVAPASLWPEVRPLVVEPTQVTDAEVQPFATVPALGSPLRKLPHVEKYLYALRWSIARARSVEAITAALAARTQPAVVWTYFQCSDSLLHRFWIFHKDESEIRERFSTHKLPVDLAPTAKQHFGNVVQQCYRDIDDRVGRLLATLRGPETMVLVVSDHGFGDAPKPHRAREEPYGGNHRDLGVIIAAGPAVPRRGRIEGASVLDIAPTVLYLTGMPVGLDMRGRVIPELSGGAEQLARLPPQTLESYETVPQTEVPFADGWPPRKNRPVALDQ